MILNVASADDVFGSVADSTIFLFIGSFIIAEAMLVPLSPGERNTLIAFGLAIFLWTLPGLVGLFFGDDSKLYESLSDRWLDEGVSR